MHRALLCWLALTACSPLIDTGAAPFEDGAVGVDVGGVFPDGGRVDGAGPPFDGGPRDARVRLDGPRDGGPRDGGRPLDGALDLDGGLPLPLDGAVGEDGPVPDAEVAPRRVGRVTVVEPFDETRVLGGPPGFFVFGGCPDEDAFVVGVEAAFGPSAPSALRPVCGFFDVWTAGGGFEVRSVAAESGAWVGTENPDQHGAVCPPGAVISDFGGGSEVFAVLGLYLGCAAVYAEADDDAPTGVRVRRAAMDDFVELGDPEAGNYFEDACPRALGAAGLLIHLNPVTFNAITRFGLECGAFSAVTP